MRLTSNVFYESYMLYLLKLRKNTECQCCVGSKKTENGVQDLFVLKREAKTVKTNIKK